MATETTDKSGLSAEQIADENRQVRGLLGNDGTQPGDDDVETRRGSDDRAGEGDDVETRKPPLRAGKFQERRAEIAAKAKQLRDERNDPELTGDIADHRERMFGRNVDQPDLRAEPGADGADNQPPVKRKLKVNGQEIELDDDQIIEHAQRSLAAGDILERAKRDKDEAQSVLQQLREAKAAGDTTQPAGGDPKPKPAEKPDTTAIDDASMDDIIDKIQVGDAKEAKEALKKFGDGLIERVIARVGNLDETIARTVGEVNEGNQRRKDTASTLEQFAKDNPDVARSRGFQSALAQETADTMRAHMKAIGVDDEVYGRLKAERRIVENGLERPLTDIEATAYAYRKLSSDGYELPTHAEVLKTSAASLRKQFGMPEIPAVRTEQQRQPGNQNNFSAQDREERKRVMNPQPRRATIPSAVDASERSREEKQLAAVRQMKAARRGRV